MRHRIRVGVLRGGPSSEYEVSLKTGAAMLKALRDNLDDTYEVKDVLIDRQGVWHVGGVEINPYNAHHYFDVALNALHGSYGEDGGIQKMLEGIGMPFTGSDSLGSALGMNKLMTKNVLKAHGIKSPYWKQIRAEDILANPEKVGDELFNTFILPAVIKPNTSGSSIGVSIVKAKNEIKDALLNAAHQSEIVLAEEFIPGIEATCGVIEKFRGEDLYALPPVEIRPRKAFFDYSAKYEGLSDEIVPARFPIETRKAIEDIARNVHKALNLRHYSRTDVIVHSRRGIYVLETNTLPGLTEESLMPKALHAVGGKLHHLLDHLIKLALNAM